MPDFTFPANKAIIWDTIKNFSFKGHKMIHSPVDILDPKDNIITIKGTDYYFIYLNSTGENKGGNSIILKLYYSQSIDLKNIQYDEPDMVIKILKFKKKKFGETKAEKRFKKEISALKNCKKNRFQNVISISHSGKCKIVNFSTNKYEEYLYYTMEYAENDLKDFIEENPDLTFQEKISLCLNLAQGLKELESLGYYHRDIKPDNIFIVGETWKIGDLGLLAERNEEGLDRKQDDFIGPKGWHSPEAFNKFLCEGKNFPFKHDCKIDHQSDIFQLGMVFWYILQNNAPTGVFKQQDTYIKSKNIYPVVRTMLNYSKKKRYSKISQVIDLLKPIESNLLLD